MVKRISLPISRIVIEDVQVDIAGLNNPHLNGSQYQDPTRLDENLRLACLMRDSYHCQNCGKKNSRLEAHHIIYREHGGKIPWRTCCASVNGVTINSTKARSRSRCRG